MIVNKLHQSELSKAIKMRDAFVSREIWDGLPLDKRYKYLISMSLTDYFVRAGKLVLGVRYLGEKGWPYTYDEMMAILDKAIKLIKLEIFA